MSKMDWEDKQLEDLLREMPKINDNQNPDDLYQAISLKLNKKKRYGKFKPMLAGAAAIMLFIFLIPSLFQFEEQVKKESIQESKEADMNNGEQQNLSLVDERSAEEQFDTMMETEPMKIAVYKEDMEGKEVLVYGIPDRQALNIVPISILVNKDESLSWFDRFVDHMPKLTEESWGLSEYYPLQGRLSFDSASKTVHINLVQDHLYGAGSAAELNFQNAVITSFRNREDVNKIAFSTENIPGVQLGNNELNQINLHELRAVRKPYLLLYVENKHVPMLVQREEQVATFEEALRVMKKDEPTQGLIASIPDELKIDKISIREDHISIQIGNQADIPQTTEVNIAIEAILLSAKEFGYSTVEFKHDKTAAIGPFPTNQPIEVPIAANKQEMK